jgi:hypothetical protein
VGNWLTAEQGRRLLHTAKSDALRAQRDHAMLAVMIGCGLRRGELLTLRLDAMQQREDRWVIADLHGKAGHIRTVPIPAWVKATVDTWTTAAGLTTGRVFRAINKAGIVWGNGMTPKVIWEVVRAAAHRADIAKLAPHDLRRTCARLCHLGGRRTRPDSVSTGARVDPDDGTASGANRSCATPSTTRSASSRNASRNVNAEGGVCADSGGPPSAACRRPLGRLSFHEKATGGQDAKN